MLDTIGSRIKLVRESIGLSGSAFAEQLGLSRGALSNIERDVNGVSERTLRLICQIYRVDYFWLTDGKGEMFVKTTDALLDELAAENNFSTETVKTFRALLQLPPERFNLVMELIRALSGADAQEKEQ